MSALAEIYSPDAKPEVYRRTEHTLIGIDQNGQEVDVVAIRVGSHLEEITPEGLGVIIDYYMDVPGVTVKDSIPNVNPWTNEPEFALKREIPLFELPSVPLTSAGHHSPEFYERRKPTEVFSLPVAA